jgi:hypothetical protein
MKKPSENAREWLRVAMSLFGELIFATDHPGPRHFDASKS